MSRILLLVTVVLCCFLPGCMSAEARLAKADELYLQGHFTGALREYQRARRKDPTLPGIDEKIRVTQIRMLIDRGDKCVQQGQWDAAVRAYEQVKRIDPKNTEVDQKLAGMDDARADFHCKKGQQLLRRSDPFQAVAEFEQALIIKPDHRLAASGLARARQEKSARETKAEQAYQEGVRARQIGQHEEAIRSFTRAVQLNPHHVSAGLELKEAEATLVDSFIRDGDRAMHDGNFTQALVFFQKAGQRQHNRPDLASRIQRCELELQAGDIAAEGEAAFAQKNWQLAFDRFEAASRLTAEPERIQTRMEAARNVYAEELYTTAQNFERTGRYDEAIQQYEVIARVHPRYRDCATRYRTLADAVAKAETAYDVASRAHRAFDLFKARDHFRQCLTAIKPYKDAERRLTAIEGEIGMAQRFYDRATMAETNREYSRAQLLYEECLSVVRPFQDAHVRLERLRQLSQTEQDLPQYHEACRAQTACDLQKAQQLLKICKTTRPGYRDSDKRLADVTASIQRADRFYMQAVAFETQSQLQQAQHFYEKCLAICNPYRDAQQRHGQIVATIRDLREAERMERAHRIVEARERYRRIAKRHKRNQKAQQRLRELDSRCAELDRQYVVVVDLHKKRNFHKALLTALEIRKKCVEYKDLAKRIPQLECEMDYADGQAFEKQQRPDAALRCYERLAQRNPNFKDVQTRVLECRRKAAASPRPRRSPRPGR